MKKPLLSALLASLAVPCVSLYGQDTGFNKTDAGPHDYNNSANWVSGDINGIWDDSLALSAAQVVTFGADTTLLTGLNFGYTGNFDVTLRSDGAAPRTLTLGGDVLVAPVSNRTIHIGSLTANEALDVDLGGDRTFTIYGGKALNFFNSISGGDILVTGTNSSGPGGTLRFSRDGATAVDSNITVRDNATFQIDNSANGGGTGAVRVQSLTLQSGGALSVRGNNTSTHEIITGAVTTDGGVARQGSSNARFASITLDAGNAHTLLSIGSLERTNRGTLLVRGENLGVNSIVSQTGGSTNVQITGTATPQMVGGGGGIGTNTQSIVPWLVGGSTLSDNGSTFVTYSATHGLRPLDVATEFASSIGGNATDNVRLVSAATLDTEATVNSLILGAAGASLTGTGTLHVTSGAVLMTRTTGASSPIGVNLDFGSAEGIIGYNRGDEISGAIAGSGGLTVHGTRSDERIFFSNGTTTTYTGDTTILSNAMVATGFLPYGDREGNVYVYGNLQLDVAGYTGTINGLYGNGRVAYGNSSTASITIGDNDADGDFSGTIAGNNNLRVIKTGTGTQIFSGTSTYGRGTIVEAGTLLIMNTEGSATGTGTVTVAGGARFGGAGMAAGQVISSADTATIIAGGVDSVGKLTLSGGLDADNGVTFQFKLNGSSADLIDFGAGLLDMDGDVTFHISAIGSVNTGTPYTLLTGTGNWTGSTPNFTFITPSGYILDTSYGDGNGYIFDNDGIGTNSLSIQLAAIPEPAGAMMLVLGGALLAGRRRKRS